MQSSSMPVDKTHSSLISGIRGGDQVLGAVGCNTDRENCGIVCEASLATYCRPLGFQR